MRVKMNNTESGLHPDFNDIGQYHCLKGHEYDVPDDLAQAWVAQGIATKVTAKKSTPQRSK